MNLDMQILTEPDAHPLDWLETMFTENQWFFERHGENEIFTSIEGDISHYQILFQWQSTIQLLNISCRLDAKYVESRNNVLYEMLARVNERLWVGHFEIEHHSLSLLFRASLPLYDGSPSCQSQLKETLDIMLAECNRYYPAFQYVIWGNLRPKEALQMTLMETAGVA
ncbi:MAG: YbjN domain-containing protein [Alphaproteobacteria bacterium]|nr:YbjN domain-containing protein [Alphaproteobacteria bacterium]